MSPRRLGQAALGAAVLVWLALGAADAAEPPAVPRQPGLWQRYKWQALGAFGIVAAQSVLLVGLLAERRRTRRARQRLDERLRFEVLLA
ncbi:MAG TPA: hypothetical protein VMQ51_13635, partial [Candidatus Binatia bacterium]|nr:hypothetical protein [Candidatus Binatia bacterium]